jgi:tetraacyldisaccharide 4'-kinase
MSAFHRGLYRSGILKTEHSARPVIVVGNVVAGGAGKTPLVIELARHFRRQGLQVGVVSRGYGRHGQNCVEVLENTPISESGDEPALILRAMKRADFSAPVFIADKRSEAVRVLLQTYPSTQLILSDDGLQHYGLARDLDIIVFDDRGLGNGWLLPAGPLRMGWTPDRPTPHLVLHTGLSPAFGGYVSTRRLADYAITADGRHIPLDALKGQDLTALAGIANPNAFFDMLRARGLQLQMAISLPDHFDFSGFAWPVAADATVLCTEKDAVKLFGLPQFKGCKLLAVPLEFSPEPAFLGAVDALLAPLLVKSSDLTSPNGLENGHETA